ncbi:trans-4-hydroxy-L-proline dehydratase activase [Hominifimenecus sp. rT4P-3]|uniref:trans-4-hydroxy-L-proline dehydratase activase n=1 Tax=Hominifimenecus sp. rT4P-3 TaxID=3242979 RepID=UPI003DA2F742
MNQPYVFNIQKYSIHDGPGIRTTIFFKGCPLSCQWCHNPESQRHEIELMYYHERCTGCGACVKACPKGANLLVDGRIQMERTRCTACGACVDSCTVNARELIGKTYTMDELIKEAEKDRMFYEESGGGITLSGGEVMVQNMDYIEELCRKLHRKGYSIDIDTCGFAPYENFSRILPYVDTFLYDIKLINPEEHKKYIGTDNRLILDNLIALSKAGAKINIRIPLVRGVNATEEFIKQTIDFLKENQIRTVGINLLPYHNTGKSKYENLDRTYADEQLKVPPQEQLEQLKQMFLMNGFQNVKIGG